MAFFTGPELVKFLLFDRPTDFPKGRLQVDILKPIFGNAMISAEGRDWRWQRSLAAPLFRHDELLEYGAVMSGAAQALVAQWRAAPHGAFHAIDKDMMRAAFQVISNTMLTGGADDVLTAIQTGHADYYRGVNWWIIYILLGLPHWFPRPGGRAMRAQETRMREAVSELVRRRGRAAERGDDMLGRMIRASEPESGRRMSDELLVDNIIAFLMAGYDTTALALTWAIYLISKSPEWEAKILDEVKRVAGSGPIASEHVEHLDAVQQVLNETLRLFPTAPVIVRDIVEEMQFDGIHVPANTIGIIPIYAIHRHRNLWEDPDRFEPGRFAPDSRAKPSRFQFMPFGVGPRICIGAAFAMIEATIMLATFVRAARFEMAPDFDVQPVGRMFLLPKNGLRMRVKMREGVA
jgi:cytochrome P450